MNTEIYALYAQLNCPFSSEFSDYSSRELTLDEKLWIGKSIANKICTGTLYKRWLNLDSKKVSRYGSIIRKGHTIQAKRGCPKLLDEQSFESIYNFAANPPPKTEAQMVSILVEEQRNSLSRKSLGADISARFKKLSKRSEKRYLAQFKTIADAAVNSMVVDA
jgi:hypothetical protein